MEESFIDNNTRAIIIAVEDYRYEKISKVKYARSDAMAFKDLLISDLNVKSENIKLYLDNYATKTAIEDEIKYEIGNLSSEEKFIFYYAGHGFYENGTNKLTAWDTSDTNLSETTLALKEILIDPLENSKCKKSLIFLDACSKYISNGLSREAVSDLSKKELTPLLNQSEFCAMYISCSPGEKSYSDDNLQHGIWTYYLLEALKGKVDSLLIEGKYITDVSLREYMRTSVPKFISEKTDIKNPQTPYAILKSSGSFTIHEIRKKEEKPEDTERSLPLLNINPTDLKLLSEEFINVTEAPGYKSGSHWAPQKAGTSEELFIQNAFAQSISDEIQNIYQKSKHILNLKRKDFKKEIERGIGTIGNSIFKYDLTVHQSRDYPAYSRFERELTIYDYNLVTSEFDNIFTNKLKTIHLNCEVPEDQFESMVEKFENLAELENGKIYDDDRILVITYNTIDGLILKLDFPGKKLYIATERNYKIKDFLSRVEKLVNRVSKGEFKLKGMSSTVAVAEEMSEIPKQEQKIEE